MSIVSGVVAELTALGLENVYAHRRWHEPAAGSSVTVVTSETIWTASSTRAEFPVVKALVYSAPADGQADAEDIGVPIAGAVRRALHVTDGYVHHWGDQRVLHSQHVGSGLYEVEGHPEWRVRMLTFEVETG